MTGYEVRPAVASAADIENLLERLNDPIVRRRRRPTSRRPEPEPPAPDAGAAAGPLLRHLRPRADQLRRGGEDASVIELVHRIITEAVERGASDIHFEPGDERHARPLPHRRRAARGGDHPGEHRPRGHLAHEDPLRPRHRRAARPAGRPHLDGASTSRHVDLRVVTLPTAYGETVVMRILDQSVGDDRARAARDAAAGARALHQGLRPGPRRGARHRPDRLRQVDVALRRAQPAQHDREEHHHDRGPRRVPARGHHPGAGQQRRPA